MGSPSKPYLGMAFDSTLQKTGGNVITNCWARTHVSRPITP